MVMQVLEEMVLITQVEVEALVLLELVLQVPHWGLTAEMEFRIIF
jgi:hypothetical protein